MYVTPLHLANFLYTCYDRNSPNEVPFLFFHFYSQMVKNSRCVFHFFSRESFCILKKKKNSKSNVIEDTLAKHKDVCIFCFVFDPVYLLCL